MLSDSRNKHWLRILELSNQMYESAKQDEWQMVQQIEAERQKKIMAFFNSGVEASEAAEIIANIKQLLESDKELMQFSLEAKIRVGDAMQSLGKNKQAAGAYTAHSDSKLR